MKPTKSEKGCSSKFVILNARVWETALVAILLCFAVKIIIPYLYTPSPLPAAKLRVYQDIVAYLKDKKSWGDISLYTYYNPEMNEIRMQAGDFLLERPDLNYNGKSLKLTTKEISELSKLCREFHAVGGYAIIKVGAWIVFYPDSSLLLPMPDGVLYSIDGKDPNNISGVNNASLRPYEILSSRKPYKRLRGQWYTSRKLYYTFGFN